MLQFRGFLNFSLSVVVGYFCLLCSPTSADLFPTPQFSGDDVSSKVFGSANTSDMFPVAYGDFNADKLTDIILVTNDRKSIVLFFANDEAPFLRPGKICDIVTEQDEDINPPYVIGAAPGDFTGDGVMDLLVTFARPGNREREVVVFKGDSVDISCLNVMKKTIFVVQEPLVIDLNGDMVMDLVGERYTKAGNREKMIWIFDDKPEAGSSITYTEYPFKIINNNKGKFKSHPMLIPSSNAFVDIDDDSVPELVILTQRDEHGAKNAAKNTVREVFHVVRSPTDGSVAFEFVSEPQDVFKGQLANVVGQPIFVDLNQKGQLLHLIPYCLDTKCKKHQGIKVWNGNGTEDLLLFEGLPFNNTLWGFAVNVTEPDNSYGKIRKENFYAKSLVLRVGDYNLDGFPDLIGVMRDLRGGSILKSRPVIFENVACVPTKESKCTFPRTFNANFNVLGQYVNSTLATFFDIHEDGLIDVLVVRKKTEDRTKGSDSSKYELRAFQNSPDYDSNFIKVMVLTGKKCPTCPMSRIPYGNLIPGPVISYKTKIQSGEVQTAIAAQNYRSSHLVMDLPYTIFGIGHSPNFVETLKIEMSENRSHEWPQIIPNSQIIVIPSGDPRQWKAKLFLTPSDAVKQTFGVLVGILLGVLLIVAALQFKEYREDRRDRMQEAHRFMM